MADLMGRLGYWPGVKQPASQVFLRFPPRTEVSFGSLDSWLVAVLGMELEEQPEADHLNVSNTTIWSLAWRILRIAAYFQQEARIPIFGPGRITQIATDPKTPGAWIVEALVPSIDLIAGKVNFVACVNAARTIEWVVNSRYERTNLKELTERIERVAIKPLRDMTSSGVSTMPILKAAFLQDIPYRHLGAGVYQLGWGMNARMMNRSVVDTDSSIGSRIATTKHWTALLLRSAGLPAPVHALVSTEAEAIRAAQQLGWPLVVKPADRERSEGVTISIRDENRLLQGYKQAAELSKLILVEREVPGVCYRLMVANGDFLYAVRRRPKAVFGDGQATVGQLIDRARAENEKLPPWRRAKSITHDELCAEALAAQCRKVDDVPRRGERVALRLIESTEWGGDVEDATAEVHPDNMDIAVRSARLLGLSNAGIDMITLDISKPWHENGAIINEVNSAPHFGGTTTAKEKMPLFLKGLLAGDGRVPVEAYIGGSEATEAARARQIEMLADGVRCYLTSHEETIDRNGSSMAIAGNGLFDRAMALLMNRDVGALVMVVQTDELLKTGMPVDRIAKVNVCSGSIVAQGLNGEVVNRKSMLSLVNLCQAHTTSMSRDGD